MPLLTTRGAASSRGFGFQGIRLIKVEYVVVAGGGGGGGATYPSWYNVGGGGGAGGYRSSVIGEVSGRGASAELPLGIASKSSATISIGAGGSVVVGSSGTKGINSVFSSITSLGGGAGGRGPGTETIQAGGAGGGGGGSNNGPGGPVGIGTTGQGYDGNNAGTAYGGGGGGAQSGGGTLGSFPIGSGVSSYAKGGMGLVTAITGSNIALAGGGCGGSLDDFIANNVYDTVNPGGGNTPTSATSIDYGGGRSGAPSVGVGGTGDQNTGGGGGGTTATFDQPGGTGGSGVVIIRYPLDIGNLTIGSGLTYTNSSGIATSGNGTVVAPSYTNATYKVYTFVSGTGSITFP